MVFDRCLLTGAYGLRIVAPDDTLVLDYTTKLTGKVRIAWSIALAFYASNNFNHWDLAGLCRNALERGDEPPLITSDFLNDTLNTLLYPKGFVEKAKHLLKFLYDKGGKDFKPTDLQSDQDYTLAYAEDDSEFKRIITYLNEKYWIKWSFERSFIGGSRCYYKEIMLTEFGIEEVEKTLPKIPLIGLVDQSIATGNPLTDEKINHARKLFFSDPPTLDNMRSACEALCFVLEPMRDDLTLAITSADVNEFFLIVNRFDIRHNKASTKSLVHPEQLEWLFYSLLNTINTYTKLKNRLQP